MKCVVLGGAGFIGSHIVDALVTRNHQVRVFDMPNISDRNLKNSIDSIELTGGDFLNENDIAKALDGMEVIVHLICTTLPGNSNENPVYDVTSNVAGSLKLFNIALEKGVRKIVFASSGGTVYGIPETVPIPENHPTFPICSYGITKLAVEKYLELYRHLHGMDYVVLRLGNPYGSRQRLDHVQGAVAVFLGKALYDQEVQIWGDGSVARDYFYIDDLVSAFILAIENNIPSHLYNIGSGYAVSLNELLEKIQKVTGKKLNIRYLPARKLDVPVNCVDISRAKKELGWGPEISLEEGMGRTWKWLNS